MTSPWTPTPSSTGVERVGFLPHRGRGRTPGQLRTTQNPIGAPSSTIETADSVPPPPDGLPDLLRDWERFANEGAEMPLLIQNALLHSQVEMIRPFSTATDASDGCCWCSASSPAAGFLRRCSTGARTSSAIASATTPRSSPCWREATRAVDRDVLHRRQDPGERCHVARREDHRAARALPRDGGGDGNRDGVALVDPVCENPLVTTRSWRRGSACPRRSACCASSRGRGVLSDGRSGLRGQRRYVARELMATVTDD